MRNENINESLSREIENLQQQLELMKETLRQEISAREMLRQRVMQQEGQIRDLQRTTQSILQSRIWKTMVRLGGAVLGFDQRFSFLQRRFQKSLGQGSGASQEPIAIHRDSPGPNSPPVSGKIKFQGWAVAQSGVAKVEVGIGGKLYPATIGMSRPDVAEVYPEFPGAGNSGYRLVVDISNLTPGFHTVTLYVTSQRGATREDEFAIEVRHGGELRTRTRRENELLLGAMRRKPIISVLVPVYDTPEKWLRQCIESVLKQHYPHWELCLVDDCSREPHVRKILEEYSKADDRVQVVYRSENGHIAKATNSALEIARGEFIALLDHDDELTEDALLEVAIAHNENPAADWIYSDEDKIDEDGFCSDAFYKPDWSPEYFLTCMYTCHLGVYRAELVRSIGGFRPEVNGAQDYDLALRLAARKTVVHHIPKVLYHWRTLASSTASGGDAKNYAYPAAQQALTNYLQESGAPGKVLPGPRHGFHRIRFDIAGEPKVSIIIPSAARLVTYEGKQIDLLRMCVSSILERSTYRNIEIVVVHNGDLRPELDEWLRGKVELALYTSERFNLAEKINLGARQASGDHFVLLNDDIEVISPDWIEQMLQYSQQAEIGAVGAKLLFPNGRIQHAGVVLLNGSPGHAYYNHPPDEIGYYLSVQLARNYIAVTGACTMTRADVFREVGGYSEDFPLNYNDVDYGLKLRDKGYRSVYVPEAQLLHYESVSKEGAGNVRPGELDKFHRKWGSRYFVDPYYNPNLPQDYPYYYCPD